MTQDYTYVLRRNLKQCLSKDSLDQAEAVLQRLKEEDPISLETRGLELELLTRKERYKEANSLAHQLVELFPGSSRVHYLTAMLYYRQKNYRIAKQHFSESTKIHPSWTLKRWLGKTLTQIGEFDEAETLLQPLLSEHPICGLDLAWLFERKKAYSQALKLLDNYLIQYPTDAFASQQRLRLRARQLSADELLEEMNTLLDLGEEISDNLVPEYIENLLRTGQGKKAREYIHNHPPMNTKLATQLAWTCHHNHAFDLSFSLFVNTFVHNYHNIKYLAALESDAKQCDRIADLIQLYESHAEQEKRLYGRLHRLRGLQ